MDEDLKTYLEGMEARLRKHLHTALEGIRSELILQGLRTNSRDIEGMAQDLQHMEDRERRFFALEKRVTALEKRLETGGGEKG